MTEENESVFIPGFSQEDLAAAMGAMGINPIDETVAPIPDIQPQPKRRRGRPRKHPLPVQDATSTEPIEASTVEKIIEPAKLTKRDEREVSDRLAKLLTGVTGLASIPTRPYVEMTAEEAKDIADPLSSYLVRNAETIPVARQVLENYDLAAIVLGLVAYLVRVYGERRNELASQPQAVGNGNGQRPTLSRVTQIQDEVNRRFQMEGSVPETSVEDNPRVITDVGYGGIIPGV